MQCTLNGECIAPCIVAGTCSTARPDDCNTGGYSHCTYCLFSENQYACADCSAGYGLDTSINRCTSCGVGYSACSPSSGFVCAPGYAKHDPGYCAPICPDGCTDCSDPSTCSSCSDGYTLSGTQCSPIPAATTTITVLATSTVTSPLTVQITVTPFSTKTATLVVGTSVIMGSGTTITVAAPAISTVTTTSTVVNRACTIVTAPFGSGSCCPYPTSGPVVVAAMANTKAKRDVGSTVSVTTTQTVTATVTSTVSTVTTSAPPVFGTLTVSVTSTITSNLGGGTRTTTSTVTSVVRTTVCSAVKLKTQACYTGKAETAYLSKALASASAFKSKIAGNQVIVSCAGSTSTWAV